MTIRSKAVLKGYFNTGDIPSEDNFSDMIETMPPREYLTVGPTGSDADYICDGIDDQVQIQAAIDQIATIPEVIIKYPDGSPYSGVASRGKVILLRGAYSIGGTINVKHGIHLVITENAVLYPVVNVDVINLQGYGHISGGGIITSAAFDNYSRDMIHVDGSEIITGATSIRDLILEGGIGRLATAIHFYAGFESHGEVDLTAIYGVLVDNIRMTNFGYGIKLKQLYFNFVADNFFTNLMMIGCQISIHIEGNLAERGPYNNYFTNINIIMGVSVPTGTAIYCTGWENHFEPIMIWDVETGTSVNFTALSLHNIIEGRLESNIVNNGAENVITNYGL